MIEKTRRGVQDYAAARAALGRRHDLGHEPVQEPRRDRGKHQHRLRVARGRPGSVRGHRFRGYVWKSPVPQEGHVTFAYGCWDASGANGRMLLVLFQQGSDFDKRMKAMAPGEPAHLDEEEIWGEEEEEEETEGVDARPRGAKRVRIDTGSAAGSSTWMGEYSITRAISADVGAGWLTQYNAVKLILPVADAAQQLVAFYEHVVEKASAQIRTRAAELKMLAFTLGSVSLVLSGTDIIHWDWIIDFAMSMEDSTNAGNPIQYSSTVASKWQQNTIKVELLLDGVAAA